MPTDLLIILLAILAGYVAYGLYHKRIMWHWIVLYWCVLTAKNMLDLLNCG